MYESKKIDWVSPTKNKPPYLYLKTTSLTLSQTLKMTPPSLKLVLSLTEGFGGGRADSVTADQGKRAARREGEDEEAAADFNGFSEGGI
jgi:hypothetical protein